MDNYLINLAKQILAFTPEGITKVRFAKVLYFAHKGLVAHSRVGIKEMKFIRMPLGPVPVGFKNLSTYKDIVMTEKKNSLLYNMEIFNLNRQAHDEYFGEEMTQNISEIYKKIVLFPTSELVEISHKDPSWRSHKNGEEYFIQEEDLKLGLLFNPVIKVVADTEEQKLQAKLVEGMLDEIVDESTLLEYPRGE